MLNGIFITLARPPSMQSIKKAEQPISVTIPRVADTKCSTILDIARLVN